MINFSLTEEQKQLVSVFNKFVKDEVIPNVGDYDKKSSPAECISWPLIEKALSLKVGSINIDEEYGGAGMSDIEIALIAEELAYGDAGLAATVLSNSHAAHSISKFGTVAQKEEWLRKIANDCTNRVLTAGAFTEPNAGSDAMSPDPNSGIKTTAKLQGEEYILNGRKCFITNAGIADFYLVWARTDNTKGAPQGGVSVFIVPSDAPGLQFGKPEDKMGQRLSQQADLILTNCIVPKENLLGQEGMGFNICMDAVASSFMMVGAIGVGIARSAFDHAYNYSKQRIQGGMPIINHQAIKHKLANIKTQIEATRTLVWKCAWSSSIGYPDTMTGMMCKILGADLANMAATEAVQIFGGYGYSKEYPVEKLMRDAKVLQIYESPNETHRNGIINIMQMLEANIKK